MLTGFAIRVVFEVAFLAALAAGDFTIVLVTFGVRALGYPLLSYGFLVWLAMDTPERVMGRAAGWYWFVFMLGLGVISSYCAGAVIPLIGEFATLVTSPAFRRERTRRRAGRRTRRRCGRGRSGRRRTRTTRWRARSSAAWLPTPLATPEWTVRRRGPGTFHDVPALTGPNVWAVLVVAVCYGAGLSGFVPLFLGPVVAGLVAPIGVAGTLWVISGVSVAGTVLTRFLRTHDPRDAAGVSTPDRELTGRTAS